MKFRHRIGSIAPPTGLAGWLLDMDHRDAWKNTESIEVLLWIAATQADMEGWNSHRKILSVMCEITEMLEFSHIRDRECQNALLATRAYIKHGGAAAEKAREAAEKAHEKGAQLMSSTDENSEHEFFALASLSWAASRQGAIIAESGWFGKIVDDCTWRHKRKKLADYIRNQLNCGMEFFINFHEKYQHKKHGEIWVKRAHSETRAIDLRRITGGNDE